MMVGCCWWPCETRKRNDWRGFQTVYVPEIAPVLASAGDPPALPGWQ